LRMRLRLSPTAWAPSSERPATVRPLNGIVQRHWPTASRSPGDERRPGSRGSGSAAPLGHGALIAGAGPGGRWRRRPARGLRAATTVHQPVKAAAQARLVRPDREVGARRTGPQRLREVLA
jgi:hypothetical protein